MKNSKLAILLFICMAIVSCKPKIYSTNGETIYKTGKNIKGEKMLDKSASRITIVSSCITCHGKNGDRMNGLSIQFSSLSNPNNFTIPYNDSLVYRFLDDDLKSDGTKADIGVIWKMNDQDKKDLLDYLKTL
ncbi:c-type cytochrome [Flavobacterium aestivum]|uniref:c-type cytochrome n=1 Tax=Flavobacterium aestivum TaxID=3003257 RepID=UPI002286697D|nr:c-type cytochrome [Flavobacterium aestivum]